MKMKILGIVGPLSVLLAAGCIDAGDREDCLGLSCPGGFSWPEGGEIRVNYVDVPDGEDITQVMAFFVEDQTPEMEPLPPIGSCFEWSGNFTELESRNRTYVDVGESVTFNLGGNELVAVKQEGGYDYTGRGPHDIWYLTETVNVDVSDYLNKRVVGVDTHEFGELDALYVPPRVKYVTPKFKGAPIQIKKGEDLLIEYAAEAEMDPSVATTSFLLFETPGTHEGRIVCMGLNNGKFLVPGDTYRTHLAAGVLGTYLNLSTEGLYVGMGMYRPEPAVLQKFRSAVDADKSGGALVKIVSTIRRKG
jgi:hypothetical protein